MPGSCYLSAHSLPTLPCQSTAALCVSLTFDCSLPRARSGPGSASSASSRCILHTAPHRSTHSPSKGLSETSPALGRALALCHFTAFFASVFKDHPDMVSCQMSPRTGDLEFCYTFAGALPGAHQSQKAHHAPGGPPGTHQSWKAHHAPGSQPGAHQPQVASHSGPPRSWGPAWCPPASEGPPAVTRGRVLQVQRTEQLAVSRAESDSTSQLPSVLSPSAVLTRKLSKFPSNSPGRTPQENTEATNWHWGSREATAWDVHRAQLKAWLLHFSSSSYQGLWESSR